MAILLVDWLVGWLAGWLTGKHMGFVPQIANNNHVTKHQLEPTDAVLDRTSAALDATSAA